MFTLKIGYEIEREKLANLEAWIEKNEDMIIDLYENKLKNGNYIDEWEDLVTKSHDVEGDIELDPCFIGTNISAFDDDDYGAPATLNFMKGLSGFAIDDLKFIRNILLMAIEDGVDIGDLKNHLHYAVVRGIELF